MPSRYRIIDPTYTPPAGTVIEDVHSEIETNPDQHSSRTLVVRLYGNPGPPELQEVVDALDVLISNDVVRSTWIRMDAYIENVVQDPDLSISLGEIIQGSRVSLDHARERGRTTAAVQRELNQLESLQ